MKLRDSGERGVRSSGNKPQREVSVQSTRSTIYFHSSYLISFSHLYVFIYKYCVGTNPKWRVAREEWTTSVIKLRNNCLSLFCCYLISPLRNEASVHLRADLQIETKRIIMRTSYEVFEVKSNIFRNSSIS